MYPCVIPDRANPERHIGPDSRPLFIRHVLDGCKPPRAWTVGPELELFGYTSDSLERIRPRTVDAVLAGFEAHGARCQYEDERRIEAAMDWGWITVEPGGQIEFSGANRSSLADIERDARRFLEMVTEIGEDLGVWFVASGFDPLRRTAEQRWYPKRRYAVMRPYFAIDGRRGWDMMCRTSAIQVNIDYESEGDLAAKFLVGNRLGPIVAAMFANSPLEGGKVSRLQVEAVRRVARDGSRPDRRVSREHRRRLFGRAIRRVHHARPDAVRAEERCVRRSGGRVVRAVSVRGFGPSLAALSGLHRPPHDGVHRSACQTARRDSKCRRFGP